MFPSVSLLLDSALQHSRASKLVHHDERSELPHHRPQLPNHSIRLRGCRDDLHWPQNWHWLTSHTPKLLVQQHQLQSSVQQSPFAHDNEQVALPGCSMLQSAKTGHLGYRWSLQHQSGNWCHQYLQLIVVSSLLLLSTTWWVRHIVQTRFIPCQQLLRCHLRIWGTPEVKLNGPSLVTSISSSIRMPMPSKALGSLFVISSDIQQVRWSRPFRAAMPVIHLLSHRSQHRARPFQANARSHAYTNDEKHCWQ